MAAPENCEQLSKRHSILLNSRETLMGMLPLYIGQYSRLVRWTGHKRLGQQILWARIVPNLDESLLGICCRRNRNDGSASS